MYTVHIQKFEIKHIKRESVSQAIMNRARPRRKDLVREETFLIAKQQWSLYFILWLSA
jgi:hypothetical protein